MKTKRKLTAREAMAIVEVFGAWTERHVDTLALWKAERASTRRAFRVRATRMLRALRRLGFSVVPTPPRRGRGKR